MPLSSLYNQDGLVEAGCDEAGRGCLAGSVYAAAVILPADYKHPLLNDSKQLTARRRYALRADIDPVFLPRPLKLVDVLPRSETGKLPRAALLAALHR